MKMISGIVQKGHSRGKQLGFPTINFPLTEHIDEGVYLSYIVISEKKYNALTFIGAARTFNETAMQAETYVFDFGEDVYGKNVIVSLLKKLRNNIKFDSAEALVAQMEEDKRDAEKYFKKL